MLDSQRTLAKVVGGLEAVNGVLARREGYGVRQKLYVSCTRSVGVALKVAGGRGYDEGGSFLR